ncbi:MAG: serine/threonine protein kinase [Chloroflexi bacterium]|nr:serine/threonine protein kinase [Chloroflexota bacterium]
MDNNLQPGQMLGPYRIINQIGQGGMASVYKAYQPSMDRNVAIKVLPGQLAQSAEFTARFQQEARIIARLEHPHILPVFDYGESDGISYFVMRYLEAGTLKTKMETGPLSLREIDRLFTQLAEALGYAHARGVIHRDLKPANALIDEQGNLFLTDFGIAKLLESASPRLTQTDAIMGTPAYISPEQAKAIQVDQRSDIYSLGIILYEMVTGRVPFVADTPLAVILKHVSDPLPLPSAVKSGIPESIERVILKALAKEPDDRYATAAEFLSAWKRALEDAETVLHTPEPTPAPIPRTQTVAVPSQPKPVTVSTTASKPGTSTGWIVGCFIGACLLLTAGGVMVFGTGFLAALGQDTETPFPTATEASIPPTGTPIPGPTSTPVSVVKILLEDDFSDSSQWGTLTDSDNSIEYDGDTFRMQIFRKNWFVWSTPNLETYRNIHAEVTVTNNDGESTTSFGIICNKQPDVTSYHYLAMASDGEYVIGRATEGEVDVFLTNNDQWAFSDLIEPDLPSYRVGADCANGTLTLYVNGEVIASVTDTTYTSGGVGLFAWSGANATAGDVTFDDFIMTSLE